MNGIDILVLHYLNGKNEDYELNQSFWTFSYSANVEKIVKKLIKNGYIDLGFDLEKSLRSCKVPELKEILKSNSLPVSGKKDDLIKRIIDSADPNSFQHLLKRIWTPSAEGEKIINDTDFIMYAHRHLSFDININDVYNEYLANKSDSQKGVLIKAVNRTIRFNSKTESYPPNISFVLWELSKVCRYYKDDFGQYEYLVKACVSCFIPRREREFMDYMFSEYTYFYNEFNIPSNFIDDLKMVLSNNSEYLPLLPKTVDSITSDFKSSQYFSSKEIFEIISASLVMDEETLLSIYEKAYKRKGGKIQPKKQSNLKALATPQKREESFVSKIFNIFKS